MAIKRSFRSRISNLTKTVKHKEHGLKQRERDFGNVQATDDNMQNLQRLMGKTPRPEDPRTRSTDNLPVPTQQDNITPNQQRSIALQGNTNAMKHGLFSKRAPAMTCENCYLVRSVMDENYKVDPDDVKCPYYKLNSVCVYLCLALECNIRDKQDVKKLMEETIEMDMQRIQYARAIEVYDGGGVLDQALDMGIDRLFKNMQILKDYYRELEHKPPGGDSTQKGILSQLLQSVEEAEVVEDGNQ